ncbi:S58 family peptidase [Sphingomonas koreensis]|jgi:D-aminopeptidase|uniref:Aminopeptidase n=1 Tax=Sphingomonas koreensis TaxID=93064 RepID=A0A1L6JAG0_9SPHN|nr:P1 family peptidase [Sphingomonas koreensis]APR52918.1 aminopeptidase [Sphingomonas koreensis]MDC7811268.1 P1 family peptidase [Sphingomonas koreensis]RSU18112.1 S58 family peptidase [Sphingomonas koreensis]RSU23423.1 S58 family peptidase [Sphingomonas koreensis]RSU25352.1 S58 family peptidase [Sphingomonas koreensis]
MRAALAILLLLSETSTMAQENARPRAREAGVSVGILEPGPLNAITDVAGVKVGQVTLPRSREVNTGVTAVLPHGGNLFQDKVPAGFVAYNAFGKFMGSTQVAELGEIETPILLTNTLNVAEAAAGAIEWTLTQPGNGEVRSVNAVVGETNDGWLNDIRARRVSIADARRAIEIAKDGPVAEGAVGAGTGTVAFGYKAGIGTSSRKLPASLGGWTVGVLVQSNYGGVLTIAGEPVGVKLGRYDYRQQVEAKKADGSVVIVIATDAPLSDRNLRRIAERAFAGIARTGSSFSNGSGDYAIAFSTSPAVRRTAGRREGIAQVEDLANDRVSPLFQATIEATEEAVLNSLFKAETVTGHRGTAEALPLDKVLPLLKLKTTKSR